jgi:hypothetical protein
MLQLTSMKEDDVEVKFDNLDEPNPSLTRDIDFYFCAYDLKQKINLRIHFISIVLG